MSRTSELLTVQRPSRKKLYITVAITVSILGYLYYKAFTGLVIHPAPPSRQTFDLILRFIWEPFFGTSRAAVAARANVPNYLSLMGETIAIAFAGTLASSILAVPFGFLASRNMGKKFSFIGKGLLNGIRAFPDILFAIIFVRSVGMGPYAGVLAISINSIGMLGKLYSEAIEAIDMEVINALKASGANRLQVLWYGVLPQVLPEFQSYALYRYEIDVRASTVLGFVGAGGIGTRMILDSNMRNWEAIGMMVAIIIVSVIIIDQFSSRLRKKII